MLNDQSIASDAKLHPTQTRIHAPHAPANHQEPPALAASHLAPTISGVVLGALKTPGKTPNHTQGQLHPRNVHRAPYNYLRLTAACPELHAFVRPHSLGGETITFSDPAAVLALNRALLKLHYGITHWEIPPGFLCPSVPSRADYLHTVADLLAEAPLSGSAVRVLDLGTGANCIYPLVGTQVYGWRFVATEADPAALEAARANVAANPELAGKIECRLQPQLHAIFDHVVWPDETFALSVCNPPFHDSPEAAAVGTTRKLRRLGADGDAQPPLRHFGGRNHELWCDGGEVGFVRRMIAESARRPGLCSWFTTLVSSRGSLPAIQRALAQVKPTEVRTLTLFAGQKQSRVVAWTFREPTGTQTLDEKGSKRSESESSPPR